MTTEYTIFAKSIQFLSGFLQTSYRIKVRTLISSIFLHFKHSGSHDRNILIPMYRNIIIISVTAVF